MITIQSVMLVVLGFLLATLLVLILAPAYWRRAVRLTTQRIKQAMPLTEAEIRADKDRIKADYAIKVHRLESKVEQSTLASARQQIELNRRDANISGLEGEIGKLRTSLEEHENARRVLEQTITDRFPRVEQRLNEAKKLLFQRDREIASLTETASRQAKSLEEAAIVNTQQRDELLKLNSMLATYAARSRENVSDPRFNAEVALRSEIETLKAELRERDGQVAAQQRGGGVVAAVPVSPTAINADIERMRRELVEAQQAMKSARGEVEAMQIARAEYEQKVREERQKSEDLSVEVAKLKAALAAYEKGDDDRSVSIKDSRIAMKARLGSLQAEKERQVETIQKLRTEIAAANEKLARQAAHFVDEMRRIGSGPASPAETPKRPLSQRIQQAATRGGDRQAPAAKPARQQAERQEPSRVTGFLKALGGSSGARERAPISPDSERSIDVSAAVNGLQPTNGETAIAAERHTGDGEARPERKSRLIERIADVSKG